MRLKTTLDDITNIINNSGIHGLSYHGTRHAVAIWGVGNCILVAKQDTSSFVSFIWEGFKHAPPDEDAGSAWNTLCGYWKEFELTKDCEWIALDELAAEAFETWSRLALKPPDEQEWKAQRQNFLVSIAPDATSDGIERQVEADWKEFCLNLECHRAAMEERTAAANKTSLQAARDFWHWVEANRERVANMDNYDKGTEQEQSANIADTGQAAQAKPTNAIEAEHTTSAPAGRVDQAPAASARAPRVFICHASEDNSAATDLYRRLKAEQIDVWLDTEKILPGQDWDFEITRAVRTSDVVIVCLSRASVDKEGYVQKEIKFALDVADEKPEGTIFLIPLKLEECNVPSRLRHWQWVDYFAKNGHRRLMSALRERAKILGIQVPLDLPLAAVMAKYEGQRIKARGNARPDQFYVFKGELHYLDGGAAEVCEKSQRPYRVLDVQEEFILSDADRGDDYNELQMRAVLGEIPPT